MAAKGMATAGRRDSDADLVGLPWAAENAPSAVMREFASVALAGRLTMGDIKRRLNDRDGTALTTRNVAVHFTSNAPRTATIEAYADVLRVAKPYLMALAVPPFDGAVLSGGWQRAWRTLLLHAYEFADGTVERVGAWLEKVTPAQRAAIGAVVILAEQRERHGLSDPAAMQRLDFAQRFGQAFTAFATALFPDVDLFEATRQSVDSRLVRVWIELGWLFLGEAAADSDAVMDFIVRLLRGRNVDTAKMQATLARAKAYFEEGLKIPVQSGALAIESLTNKEKEH